MGWLPRSNESDQTLRRKTVSWRSTGRLHAQSHAESYSSKRKKYGKNILVRIQFLEVFKEAQTDHSVYIVVLKRRYRLKGLWGNCNNEKAVTLNYMDVLFHNGKQYKMVMKYDAFLVFGQKLYMILIQRVTADIGKTAVLFAYGTAHLVPILQKYTIHIIL